MYFNGSDEAYSPRLSDHNGAPTITSEAYLRRSKGAIAGKMYAEDIKKALEAQRKDNPNAKINFVAHSMGAAYGTGFIKALRNATDSEGNPLFTDEDFGEGYFLGTFQPNKLTAPTFMKTTEYQFTYDVTKLLGRGGQIRNTDYFESRFSFSDGHKNFRFSEFFRPSGFHFNRSSNKDKTPKPKNGGDKVGDQNKGGPRYDPK